MAGKHQRRAEQDRRDAEEMAKTLKTLIGDMKHATSAIANFATHAVKAHEATKQAEIIVNGKARHDTWEMGRLKKIQAFENNYFDKRVNQANKEMRENSANLAATQKHNKAIADDRNANRIQTEQVHGENVRFNLRMRQLYKDQSQSFQNVMNLMGGQGTIVGAGVGGLKTVFNTMTLGSEILDTRKNLEEARADVEDGKKVGMDKKPSMQTEWEKRKRRVIRNEELLMEQNKKLGVFEGIMGSPDDKNESKLARKLEVVSEWAKRNKNGIIISAASIGLMVMTFKKLLSVSPMLQKMLEVMNLAFNLILRPFGDFIGFILRPIAMMFLATAIPFFQKAYPLLMELGNKIGELLVNWDLEGVIMAVLEAFPPFEVLGSIGKALGITTDAGSDAGDVGAVGLGLAAGGVGAMYGAGKILKWGAGKIFNPLGVSGAASATAAGAKTMGAMPKGWVPPATASSTTGKVASAVSRAAGAKIALQAAAKAALALKLTNPVGWALLGWEGVTSAIKHFSPETYKGMRDATEFMGVGREFIGLGENSLAEHGVTASNWLQHQLYGEDIGMGQVATPEDGLGVNPNYSPQNRGQELWDRNQGKLPINITFNIDKVEKEVDVHMIALEVKSILETSDIRIG